jgi:hypothetical protein
MRLSRLLLVAALPLLLPEPALAQHPAPAAAARPHANRAARLEGLSQIANSGDAAALAAALQAERDPDVRVLLQARLAAMRFDPAVAADPGLRRLAAAGAPETRAAAATILGELAFARGDYREAARFSRDLEALQTRAGKADDARETGMTRRIAELLASEPVQAVEGGLTAGSSAAHRDVAGLMRVDLRVNGTHQEAVFDTGANLSVLSASTARRLGVRMIEGAASVGNSVQGSVPVRLAIADRLEIGGNILRNVAFLVIDDAALSFSDGRYTIPAIVGFPVMRAFGRFRMEPARFSVEASSQAAAPANLHAVGNELFVDASVGGYAAPLYLDSGANPTHLDAAFAEHHPQPFAGLARVERRLAGAGGTATGQAMRWRDVSVEVAGRRAQFDNVLVGTRDGETKPSPRYGVIGADLLGRFASYTLDFGAMRLELGQPIAASSSRN